MRFLDFYKRPSRDLSESSIFGGLLTVVTIVVAIGLFVSEWKDFRKIEVLSEMRVSESSGQKKLPVELDIIFPKIPCAVLSFDALDVMGNRDVSARGHLFKVRLTREGDEIPSEEENPEKEDHLLGSNSLFPRLPGSLWMSGAPLLRPWTDGEDISRKQLASNEGCRLRGVIAVNRAPGHLHIGVGGLWGLEGARDKIGRGEHVIEKLRFGEEKFHVHNQVLDGKSSSLLSDSPDQSTSLLYEYFLKVVPGRFTYLSSEHYEFFQFSATESVSAASFLPGVYFRYDISPLKLILTETRESFVQFLVRVLAIIGGIVSVLRLVGAVVDDSLHAFKKRINKLG